MSVVTPPDVDTDGAVAVGGLEFATLTVIDELVVFPALSYAFAVSVWLPRLSVVESIVDAYGAEATVLASAPST